MDNYKRLEDIAMGEFAQKGFDGVSLNEILRRAGISKGSFYHHYQGKEDLYMALVGKVIAGKWQYMEDHGFLQKQEESLFPLLQQQITAALAYVEARPLFQQFAESMLREGNTELRSMVFTRYRLENRDRLLHLVRDAMEKGEVRDDIPAEQVNDILMFFLQNLSEISGQIHLQDYEQVSRWLLDFLENGLRKR